MAVLFERVLIVGLGLIGSSLARAIRERNIAKIIIGADTTAGHLDYCLSHKIIDDVAKDLPAESGKADLVILATPPRSIAALVGQIAPHIHSESILTDVASVKRSAAEAIYPHLKDKNTYIPAHPIAGSDRAGPEAGNAALFHGKKAILSPLEPRMTPALTKMQTFWQQLGSSVEFMPADLHDRIYAYVSHLPQLLSTAVYQTLKTHADSRDELFQRFLRLSGSDPKLWCDIFLLNSDYVREALRNFQTLIVQMAGELKEGSEQEAKTNGHTDEAAFLRGFPRIVSSSLIATCTELGEEIGVPVTPFAGSGFADFTAPASRPLEEDMEIISNHWQKISALMEEFQKRLAELDALLKGGDADGLLTYLSANRRI